MFSFDYHGYYLFFYFQKNKSELNSLYYKTFVPLPSQPKGDWYCEIKATGSNSGVAAFVQCSTAEQRVAGVGLEKLIHGLFPRETITPLSSLDGFKKP